MDPTKVLELALLAMKEDDRELTVEHLENLIDWVQRRNGFMPDVDEAVSNVTDTDR